MLTPANTLMERCENVPDSLTERQQWVVWRSEPEKVPYQAHNPRRRAKVNEPNTWVGFCEALDAYGQWLDTPQRLAGVGYVFSKDDPFVGIDLDDCVDGDAIHPAARKLIDNLGGYAEISPSMTGVKIWLAGSLPFQTTGKKTRRAPWGGQIETYHHGRWFAVTGWKVTP
jgi:putative DNA primase/helicase